MCIRDRKGRTVACENFARTIPQLTLRDTVSAQANALPPWSGEVGALEEELRSLLERKYAVAVLAGTRRAAEALARDLQRDGFSATALDGPCDDAAPGTVAVLEGHLSAGADYPFARLAVFTGRRPGQQPAKKAKAKNKGLSSLTDIQPGDYVVHQNHGIGLYAGIQRLDLQGVVKDYLKIRYEKGDTLYVPVTQLDLLSRYTACLLYTSILHVLAGRGDQLVVGGDHHVLDKLQLFHFAHQGDHDVRHNLRARLFADVEDVYKRQAVHLAGIDVERDARQRPHTGELLFDALHGDHRFAILIVCLLYTSSW